MANRFLGALGDRKSGMVLFVRRGRERNTTGHSDIRLFRTRVFLRKPEGVGVGCECVVVIATIRPVRSTAFRVAPHPVFQDGIPNETSASVARCGILADARRIDRSWESPTIHEGLTPKL